MPDALTVLGPVSTAELGLTLIHEHLLFDFMSCLAEPRNSFEQEMASQPVNSTIRGALRFNPCLLADNLLHTDTELAVEEINAFKAAGGGTVVDPTNSSIGRNPLALKKIAEATGLNIIMGSGHYYQIALDDAFARRSVEDITAEIIKDVTVGVADTGVRAGLIGEVGTSSPITASEEKSLRAAARAQAQTRAPLMIHLDGWKREGNRVLDIIESEGGNLNRTILCHMNPSWFDLDYQSSLAERGAYIEYDMFGIDHFYPPDRASPGEIPALESVAKLIDIGYENNLLLSQDVYLKMMLKKFGGYGYDHLFTNLPPYIEAAGITGIHLNTLLVENPKQILAFI
jgi:phosphotriesterase-related protein